MESSTWRRWTGLDYKSATEDPPFLMQNESDRSPSDHQSILMKDHFIREIILFHFFKKNWLHACVYHHRMKPKVGRYFTSERGEGVKGEVKNISLHWLQGIFETVPYVHF